MPTTLTANGVQYDNGVEISSVPFMYQWIEDNSSGINSSFSTHTTTPDWQMPARSKGTLYFYFPQRNDNGSWGGGYLRIYYRINSGNWVNLGHSGYSQCDSIMVDDAQRIDSQCQSFSFDWTSISSNFTVAFRFDFEYYDGNGSVIGSCATTNSGNSTYTVYHDADGNPTNYGGCYSRSHICLIGQGYSSD